MTDVTSSVLGVTKGVASLSVLANSTKMLNNSLKHKPSTKNTIKDFANLTVGIGMTDAISKM